MALTIQRCPLCGFLSPSLQLYVSHFRMVHSKDPNFSVSCGIDGCVELFRSFSAYNSHVYRRHRAALGINSPLSTPDPEEIAEHQQLDLTTQVENCNLPNEDSFWEHSEPRREQQIELSPQQMNPPDYSVQCQKSNADFLMTLSEGRQLSQQAISDVIGGCRKICQQTVRRVMESTSKSLEDAGIDISAIPGLIDTFLTLPDPFEGIDSPYLRERYYSEHMNYVAPQDVPFGEPFYTDQFTGSKRRKVRKVDSFYYVPLLDTLKNLLSNYEIQAEVLNPHFSESNELRDFCDGEHFKSHPLFSTNPTSLQIMAYYDELEVVNPIGSYIAKHKLGCLFFTLCNIRPQYRSNLNAINLIAVAKHKDICAYGLDTYLSPFVDDLKTLYCDGIKINIGGIQHTFYGGLLAFLADNLAAHALGGFKGSMSFALRICRSCMITGPESQSCFLEEDAQLRTPNTHFNQCELLEGPLKAHYSTNFGINRLSILEDVPGFSVTTCIPHDIMHDLFEGVVPYELKLLLVHCTQVKKYFTINFLNDRIDRFDFIHDKPTLLDVNLCRNTLKIRQSASQMMVLCRYLPILIGDKIPEDDENWKSYLILLQICSVALTPVCTNDTVPYLAQLIEEKLRKFIELYPGSRLIPKFHYMIHYPSQIENFGPLIHSWTMRQESKLSFIKRCSKRSNFKNVAQTAAKKHQLWQCYKMHVGLSFLHTNIEESPKSYECDLEAEDEHVINEISRLFPGVDQGHTTHPEWVKLHSFVYRKSAFVLLSYNFMEPTFGKIIDIIKFNDVVMFSLQVHPSHFFHPHYHCYVVKHSSHLVCVSLHSLSYNRPLYCKHSFALNDNNKYISLPFMH